MHPTLLPASSELDFHLGSGASRLTVMVRDFTPANDETACPSESKSRTSTW
jgi:hypothetical protein